MLHANDVLVLGAESFKDDKQKIKLKEISLSVNHPWIGERIRDLDISRHSIIVLIKRRGKRSNSEWNMILRERDVVIIYTQTFIPHAERLSCSSTPDKHDQTGRRC